MNTRGSISILVCWEGQTRSIPVKADDELNTIETAISNVFQLQDSSRFDSYQAQFYDQCHKIYLDLHAGALPSFRELIEKLASDTSPPKHSQSWRLKMVPRVVTGTISPIQPKQISTMGKAVVSKSINLSPADKPLNLKMDDSQEATLPFGPIDDLSSTESNTDIFEIQPVKDQSLLDVRNPNHPLNFHFEIDIASPQRKQYESEMIRRKVSDGLTVGGVLLRAATNDSGPATDCAVYPTTSFQIPKNLAGGGWLLRIYILTQRGPDGTHYLHASKGIYDHVTPIEDRFGVIPDSKLVNPLSVELTANDIQQGRYQLRLRVCNIRNLSHQRQERLRIFPPLDRFIMYQDPQLLSKHSTNSLEFSSEKYHVGCCLIYKTNVRDRCISNLAIDENKRKQSLDAAPLAKMKQQKKDS